VSGRNLQSNPVRPKPVFEKDKNQRSLNSLMTHVKIFNDRVIQHLADGSTIHDTLDNVILHGYRPTLPPHPPGVNGA
jgi:hypothetical protein